jgi:hypothetical protein
MIAMTTSSSISVKPARKLSLLDRIEHLPNKRYDVETEKWSVANNLDSMDLTWETI